MLGSRLLEPFRDLYGYAISAKRYCLFEGKNVRKIVDSKAHGIGYLMNPVQRKRDKDQGQFTKAFWQCVLQNEGISFKREEPEWLDLPAMMRIPVSSPAVLGRLKDFCKPYDFVLAPVVRDGDFNLDEEAKKPILVTRFEKDGEEWVTATYFNVRTANTFDTGASVQPVFISGAKRNVFRAADGRRILSGMRNEKTTICRSLRSTESTKQC